jgi:hypothetical protein
MSNNPVASGRSSSRLAFQCPACRAKQPLQDTCRRCGADLSLLALAKRRVAWLLARRQAACAAGDFQYATLIQEELDVLQPGETS